MSRGPLDLRRYALLALTIVAVSACGTTVPTAQQQAAEVAVDEIDAIEDALPPGATINDKGQVVSSSGEVLGTAEDFGISTDAGSAPVGATGSTGSSGMANVSDSGGAGTSVPPASAPGVTDTKIYVGSYYMSGQTGNSALGAGALEQGDARKPQNVMIKLINSQGGLAGRKIVPIYYEFDGSGATPSDQGEQAACAKYTQDNEVFAILLSGPVLDECAKEAGILELGFGGATKKTYIEYPQRYDITGIEMIRMGHVTVDGLAKNGYFGKDAKVGIVVWDEPNYHDAIDKGYIPALRRHGLSLATEPAYITSPQQLHDMGAASADVSNAVLRFKTQGITHVMVLDGPSGVCGGACLTLEWIQQADKQDYRPRHGWNDTNSPKALYELGLMPRSQALRSVSVSWVDLDASYDEGWRLNPARERCEKVMRKNDIDMSDPNARGAAMDACSTFWFLDFIINDRLGNATLTVPNVLSVIGRVGYTYDSPFSYYTYLSADRHDGTAGVRYMHFKEACDCFKYRGGAYKI